MPDRPAGWRILVSYKISILSPSPPSFISRKGHHFKCIYVAISCIILRFRFHTYVCGRFILRFAALYCGYANLHPKFTCSIKRQDRFSIETTPMKPDRARRSSQRERIFTLREDVFRLLDQGKTAARIAQELELTDIPERTLQYNISALKQQRRESSFRSSKEPPIPPRQIGDESSSPSRDERIPQSRETAPALAPKRKKRKFVSATVGNAPDDDLNPIKWREERRARKAKQE